MAYVAPTTRADGYVVPSAVWNSDVVANPIAINAGAVAIASQATGDVITAASASQLARVAPAAAKTALISNGAGVAPSFQSVTVTGQAEGDVIIANNTTSLKVVTPATAGYVLTSAGAVTPPVFAAQTYGLIHQGAGSSTAAGATNLDAFTITGLSVNDFLEVKILIQTVTADTELPQLYNVTDSVVITNLVDTGGGTPFTVAQATILGTALIVPKQSSSASVSSLFDARSQAGAAVAVGSNSTTFTTAWTGSWQLAIRHSGVTATGTFYYKWSVHRLKA